MGRYDTATVIALVDLTHAGQVYKAGTVATVPAATAVRWLMHKQAKAAPKGSVPTAAPVTPIPETPSTKPKPAPKKLASERTYQRRDLEPEE